MNIQLYVHLLGAFLLIAILGALCFHVGSGGDPRFSQRRLLAILHGIGLLMLIGTGLMMTRGSAIPTSSAWLYGKIAIWLFMGFSPTLLYRRIIPFPLAMILIVVAVVLATGLGLNRF